MNATRIKICGLTTPQDAALAVSLGADFAGVIFAASPRRVDVARAARIREVVPSTPLVGVFRDTALEEVVAVARVAGLDLLQFHGYESPAFCNEALVRTGRPIIKVFTAGGVPAVAQLAEYTTASYFLFDDGRDAPAGLATRLAQVSHTRRLGFRVFLAGGLTPDNVRDAVTATLPFAVDVCRGVERAPGVKDPAAMERFIAEVHG